MQVLSTHVNLLVVRGKRTSVTEADEGEEAIKMFGQINLIKRFGQAKESGIINHPVYFQVAAPAKTSEGPPRHLGPYLTPYSPHTSLL